MRLIEFTELPENRITPPFLRARQFHLTGFIDQDCVLSIEILANELNQNRDDRSDREDVPRTNQSIENLSEPRVHAFRKHLEFEFRANAQI